MKIFTKKESLAVFIILSVIFGISFFNFQVALRRGRDNARENDLSDIARALVAYKEENSIYPPSLSLIPRLPQDPSTPTGRSYLYLTSGKNFQLFASFESETDEALYSPTVKALNFKCGSFICNFGISSGVPLDKSLEVYENELHAQ